LQLFRQIDALLELECSTYVVALQGITKLISWLLTIEFNRVSVLSSAGSQPVEHSGGEQMLFYLATKKFFLAH